MLLQLKDIVFLKGLDKMQFTQAFKVAFFVALLLLQGQFARCESCFCHGLGDKVSVHQADVLGTSRTACCLLCQVKPQEGGRDSCLQGQPELPAVFPLFESLPSLTGHARLEPFPSFAFARLFTTAEYQVFLE